LTVEYYTLFIVIYLTAGVMAAGIGVYVWRLRQAAPGHRVFAMMMLVITVWTLGVVLEMISGTVAAAIFWSANIRFTAVVAMPVLWMVFSLHYTGRGKWLESRRISILLLIPLISITLIWTNSFHGLFFKRILYDQLFSYLIVDKLVYGDWFWVHAVYSYSLLLVGTYHILTAVLRSYDLYRGQGFVLLIGALLPGVTTAIYTFRLLPNLKVNYIPLGFALSGLVFFWGLYRYRLFDLSPIARSILVDSMSDGMLVLDNNYRIVDLNPAVQNIFGVSLDEALGQPVTQLLYPWYDLDAHFSVATEKQTTQAEIELEQRGAKHHYDLRISPIVRQGLAMGHLLVLRDITERVNLFNEVHRLAITDTLTGLYNRRYFFDQASHYVKLSKRHVRDLSLIMLDIDYFKKVNDTYGHIVGDEVLRTLAMILADDRRQTDITARYGGEEFVILLLESDLQAAQHVAQKLCKKVADTSFDTSCGLLSVTISLGVATLLFEDSESLETLLDRADQALYAAKEAGRNRVMVSSP